MSLYLGNTLLAGVATPLKIHNLFDFKWTDYELSDQNWLRADTYSWQDGTVYTNAYNHLVNDIDGKTATSETIGSYTISYYLADDGHKITTDEATVLNIYNESGVAWYYVLDTTNQRFKLPRENPSREELIQVIRAKGNGKTLGLSDGVDSVGLTCSTSQYKQLMGTYQNLDTPVGTANGATQYGMAKSLGVIQNANKSGIISDMTDSTSVYKGKKYLYFYVGQYSQTATEQTAGLNSELFNGKLDLDLGNISNTSKETIVGWGMPDYSAGISLSYNSFVSDWTAPSDGVICGKANWDSSTKYLTINGSIVQGGNTECFGIFFFVSKGDVVHNDSGVIESAHTYLTFYPLKGVN